MNNQPNPAQQPLSAVPTAAEAFPNVVADACDGVDRMLARAGDVVANVVPNPIKRVARVAGSIGNRALNMIF